MSFLPHDYQIGSKPLVSRGTRLRSVIFLRHPPFRQAGRRILAIAIHIRQIMFMDYYIPKQP
jgi:hypothetical protein